MNRHTPRGSGGQTLTGWHSAPPFFVSKQARPKRPTSLQAARRPVGPQTAPQPVWPLSTNPPNLRPRAKNGPKRPQTHPEGRGRLTQTGRGVHTCVLFAMPVAGRRTTQAVITTVTDSVVSFLRDDRGLGPSTSPEAGGRGDTDLRPTSQSRQVVCLDAEIISEVRSAEGLTPSVNYKYFPEILGDILGIFPSDALCAVLRAFCLRLDTDCSETFRGPWRAS